MSASKKALVYSLSKWVIVPRLTAKQALVNTLCEWVQILLLSVVPWLAIVARLLPCAKSWLVRIQNDWEGCQDLSIRKEVECWKQLPIFLRSFVYHQLLQTLESSADFRKVLLWMCLHKAQTLNRFELKEIIFISMVNPNFLCVDSQLLSKGRMCELAVIEKYWIQRCRLRWAMLNGYFRNHFQIRDTDVSGPL